MLASASGICPSQSALNSVRISAQLSQNQRSTQSALNSVRISRGVGQSASVDSCRPDARASRPRPATADGLELARPRRALPEVRGLRPPARAAPTSSARVLPLGMQPACPGAAARPSPHSWSRSRTRELVGPVERARCAHPGTPKGSRWHFRHLYLLSPFSSLPARLSYHASRATRVESRMAPCLSSIALMRLRSAAMGPLDVLAFTAVTTGGHAARHCFIVC